MKKYVIKIINITPSLSNSPSAYFTCNGLDAWIGQKEQDALQSEWEKYEYITHECYRDNISCAKSVKSGARIQVIKIPRTLWISCLSF